MSSPGPKRSAVEAEADRLYLFSLLRPPRGSAFAEPSISQLTAALNERRAAGARAYALATGKSADEADEAARRARLSELTVRRDVGLVLQRVRSAADTTAATFLDEQLAAVQEEIDGTHRTDEMIIEAWGRSLQRSWTRRRGRPEVDESGEPLRDASGRPRVQTLEILDHRGEEPGERGFIAELGANVDRRQRLRAEQRTLRFGREFIKSLAESQQQRAASASASGELDRDTLLLRLDEEHYALSHAEALGLATGLPGAATIERLRAQRKAEAVRRLRVYAELERGKRGADVVEMIFEVQPNGDASGDEDGAVSGTGEATPPGGAGEDQVKGEGNL